MKWPTSTFDAHMRGGLLLVALALHASSGVTTFFEHFDPDRAADLRQLLWPPDSSRAWMAAAQRGTLEQTDDVYVYPEVVMLPVMGHALVASHRPPDGAQIVGINDEAGRLDVMRYRYVVDDKGDRAW